MGRSSEALRALPVRVALLIGLALAVLLPAGLWLERVLSDRLIESRVTDLQQSLVGGLAAADGRMAMAERRVTRLAELIAAAAADLGPRDAEDFDRATHRPLDGATRLTQPPNAATDATLWIPASHPLDQFWKGLFFRSRSIVSLLGSGTVGEAADDVWYMTPSGGEIMFAPADPGYADRPIPAVYDPSAWIDPIRPERNPSGAPVWLPPQRSPRPPLWYATVLAPVVAGSKLLGVTGLDFSIGPLFNRFGTFSRGPGAAHLIVDRRGLIAYGDGTGFVRAQTDSLTIRSLPSPLRDSLEALVRRAQSAAPGAVSRGTAGSQMMLASRLGRPEWTVVGLIERAAVVAPLRAPLQLMRAALVGVLGMVLFAILGLATADHRRRLAHDDLRARAAERFNRLFQMLPVPVALARVDTGEVIEVNDAASRLTGLAREQIIGSTTADLGLWRTDEERDRVREIIREQGFLADFATKLVIPAGDEIDILISARIIEIDDEPHTLTVIQDLSEQRRLEAQLVQAQKLEAVGRLAGGVAHDFNNLLTAVIGYGELLAASLDESDERHQDVSEILNAAARGATLTKQLLGFARRQSTSPRVLDVNEVVVGLERMLKPLIGADVTFVSDLDPAIGTVLIDPGQLEQVITNLAVNARDAMPEGGTMFLRTRDDGQHVFVEVADTGSGIPDDVKAHIFEPFFTTKETGKGTGLGLATCYGIVRQAGGTIQCDTMLGHGTTFRISLPRIGTREHPRSDDRTANPVMPSKVTRRIMVVEDEEMVRTVTATILRGAGYEVVTHPEAPTALSYLGDVNAPIDLVVSDIVMPKMSGPAFGQALATSHPDLPILFISGYTPDEKLRSDLSALGHPFLAKPFSRHELLEAVATGLTPGPRRAPR